MRALVQRVVRGSVAIGGAIHASIGKGAVILLGVRKGDTTANAVALAEKCAALRIFDDAEGRMNLNVNETGGSLLVVSQFTLYAETRRGNRPGFSEAAPPEDAEPLCREFTRRLTELLGPHRVATGVFRSAMEVTILNDGPVTVILDSK